MQNKLWSRKEKFLRTGQQHLLILSINASSESLRSDWVIKDQRKSSLMNGFETFNGTNLKNRKLNCLSNQKIRKTILMLKTSMRNGRTKTLIRCEKICYFWDETLCKHCLKIIIGMRQKKKQKKIKNCNDEDWLNFMKRKI